MQGFQPGSAAYNKMVADMQRLDQVLRELQPVLKTLNDKSNALVFEAKDKKRSRAEEGETMKKWLVVMMAVWLTSCSSSGENKSYYQLPYRTRRSAELRQSGKPSAVG